MNKFSQKRKAKRSGGQNIENNPMQSSAIPPGGTAQRPARYFNTVAHTRRCGASAPDQDGLSACGERGRVEAEGATRHGRYGDAREN